MYSKKTEFLINEDHISRLQFHRVRSTFLSFLLTCFYYEKMFIESSNRNSKIRKIKLVHLEKQLEIKKVKHQNSKLDDSVSIQNKSNTQKI